VIVVSDTGPINYLALIQAADVLPALFGTVLIPGAVDQELRNPRTPDLVREWIRTNAECIEVKSVGDPLVTGALHPGEREAISLAIACSADVLLVDDSEARELARLNGLVVIGTIGVLERAAREDLVRLDEVFDRLRETNFRISERLLRDALRRHRADLESRGLSSAHLR
jgi:hypothetical protein